MEVWAYCNALSQHQNLGNHLSLLFSFCLVFFYARKLQPAIASSPVSASNLKHLASFVFHELRILMRVLITNTVLSRSPKKGGICHWRCSWLWAQLSMLTVLLLFNFQQKKKLVFNFCWWSIEYLWFFSVAFIAMPVYISWRAATIFSCFVGSVDC